MSPTISTPSTSRRAARPQPPTLPESPPKASARSEQALALAKLKQQTRRSRKQNPETELQRACLQVAQLMGVTLWRRNSGAFMRAGHLYRMGGIDGEADLTGILPWGQRLEVEVKMPGNEPTPVQWRFLRLIEAQGGVSLVVWSAAQLKVEIERLLARRTPAADVTARARQYASRAPRYPLRSSEAQPQLTRLFEEALQDGR